MILRGHRKIIIRTVDTQMLVLALSVFDDIRVPELELWVGFGAGKNREFIPIHAMHSQIDEEKSRALKFLHSFTGCDQISFLSLVTKKSAWNLWDVLPGATATFVRLIQQPSLEDVNEALYILEGSTVLLYSRSSNCLITNECRRELFCIGRSIEAIPPTSAALAKHVTRASYIASQ